MRARRPHSRRWRPASGFDYELIIVNDGSRDNSPAILDRLAESDPRLRVVHLSRNFGHQPALTAGLEKARGDVVVMLDADLQDPPELIAAMIERWREGSDIVYMVREQRDGESMFKLTTARWFYKLFRWLAQVDLAPNSGDFPTARSPRARRIALDGRAQPLPARHDRLGRLHAERDPLSPRRPLTPARRSTPLRKMLRFLARRDPLVLARAAPTRDLSRFPHLGHRGSFAIPVVIGLRLAHSYLPGFGSITIAILMLGGIQLIAIGRDRRVRRADLRRGSSDVRSTSSASSATSRCRSARRAA